MKGGIEQRRPCPRCRTTTIHIRDESPGPCGWVCSRCLHYTTDPGTDPRPALWGITLGLLLLVLLLKVILTTFGR